MLLQSLRGAPLDIQGVGMGVWDIQGMGMGVWVDNLFYLISWTKFFFTHQVGDECLFTNLTGLLGLQVTGSNSASTIRSVLNCLINKNTVLVFFLPYFL